MYTRVLVSLNSLWEPNFNRTAYKIRSIKARLGNQEPEEENYGNRNHHVRLKRYRKEHTG